MIAILSVIAGLLAMVALFRRNTPAFIGSFCITFSLAYRMVDAAYLDLAGPIYAIELEKFVGGNGGAPMFVAASLTLILPLWLICRPQAILKGVSGPLPETRYIRMITRAALAGCSLALAILYIDMVRVGPIPLFAGIDRVEYRDMAGIFHNPAYAMNFLFSAALGIFTVLPRLRGQNYSFPFIALFVILQIYWALTGNRASAFVTTATYYAIPFAAVTAMSRQGLLPVPRRDAWATLISARVITPLATVGGLVVLVSLLINSYYDVRGYSDPMYQISQRVFIQPVQLWAETWEHVHFEASAGLNHAAINQVLINPDNPEGNTSIAYLMEQSIGYYRTMELADLGQQYAGGFPEIFFELFGPWLALPVMLLFGMATSFLVRLTISSLLKGHVMTCIMAIYLLFGFGLAYIGGMINFLFAPTFALKGLGLLAVLVMERNISARSRRHGGAPVFSYESTDQNLRSFRHNIA